MSDDLGAYADLAALARHGTLSAAARRRQVAVSTLSRRIAALEARLKLDLVDRRSDGARLTGDGMAIAALAEPLAEQLSRVTRAAEALRQGHARTPIRVSATEFVISDVLAPALAALGTDGPALHLQSDPDIVSLAARGADIAIRMIRPEGATLYARRLPTIRLGLFAAPAYLAGRDPDSLDLAEGRLLVYDQSYGPLPELAWLTTLGVTDRVVMQTGSTGALLAAAVAGAGIALLPVHAALAAGLVALPAPMVLPERRPWMVIHRDSRHDPAIRRVQRWILGAFAARFGATPPPA